MLSPPRARREYVRPFYLSPEGHAEADMRDLLVDIECAKRDGLKEYAMEQIARMASKRQEFRDRFGYEVDL